MHAHVCAGQDEDEGRGGVQGSLETLHTAAEVLQRPEHVGLSVRLARRDWKT